MISTLLWCIIFLQIYGAEQSETSCRTDCMHRKEVKRQQYRFCCIQFIEKVFGITVGLGFITRTIIITMETKLHGVLHLWINNSSVQYPE